LCTPRAEVLEVDLVHDAEAGRHDAEGVERVHAPLHELVALLVAGELQLHVEVERLLVAEVVDHHRVVDHQVDRHQRLDRLRVLAHLGGHVAHRGQVGQQRHAGEVLQHDASDDERDLVGALGGRLPAGELLDVLGRHLLAVAVAQHALQHDAHRDRQAVHVRVLLGELGQGEEAALLAGCGLETLEGLLEGVWTWNSPVWAVGWWAGESENAQAAVAR
jgi:hypothetical protein